ncbi:PepSY domain-containing protein [Chitinophaga parva]|uniref:PepSY domain-containing protein n=1 Tax=Chitinophaga parva TaxID=2169414 RepID=A0A2T7BJX5_9BACT|nr:PepSY-associated TM helix domain-containing protein [Chitinophaga parva]PUZ27968.1 PepSY domain-containing protein [Chitinophaga parva]
MTFRKLINTLHLYLGLVSGILILIVATTGCILAFEDEIRFATQHSALYVTPENKPQASVEQLISVVKKYDAKAKLAQVRYLGNPSRAVLCYLKDKRIIFVNPYNEQVVSVRNPDTDFFTVVLSIHRTLMLGKTGETIILCNVVVFLVMVLSGFVLWLPRKIKQLKQAITIKANASAKRRYFDLHSVFGFYGFIPLVMICLTGISMATGGSDKKVRSLQMGTKPSKNFYDSLVAQVYHKEPVEMLRVSFPADSMGVVNVLMRYETNGLRKQSSFTFDRYSGVLLKSDTYQDKPFIQRFFGSSYEIHTGRVFGIPGKIIMFLAGLIALSLPITGWLIWTGKRKKKPAPVAMAA